VRCRSRSSRRTDAVEKANYAAIADPQQVGSLLRAICDDGGRRYTVAALKLSPLMFGRPGELRTAEWCEIDLDAAEWRIPGAKIKNGRGSHRAPFGAGRFHLARATRGDGRYGFPSIRTVEPPMSENTVNAALRGMGYAKEVMTAHGFRATAHAHGRGARRARGFHRTSVGTHAQRSQRPGLQPYGASASAARDDAALVRLPRRLAHECNCDPAEGSCLMGGQTLSL